MNRQTSSVLRGAAVLSFSALIVKTVGAFFKVPLGILLGGEGLSCYMAAFELFGPVYALTAAGVPTLMARKVSRGDPVNDLYTTAGRAGAMGSILLAVIALPACALVGNKGAVWAVWALCPGVYLGCKNGCLRGYFQGFGNMLPTALSQLAESVIKLLLGLYLCGGLVSRGYPLHFAAASAALGVTAGSAVCFVWLRFLAKNAPLKGKFAAFELRGGLPVCLCNLACGFCATVDLFTITRLAGPKGAFLYGSYAGVAQTLINLLPALCSGVGSACLPPIAKSHARGSYVGGLVKTLYRCCLLAALPLGSGLAVTAPDVLLFLFGNTDTAAAALLPLRILCIYGVIWCLVLPLFLVLQAIGQDKLPLYFCAVGAAVKLVLNISLLPLWGTPGAAWASVAAGGAVLVFAGVWVYRLTGGGLPLLALWHAMVGSALCCMAAHFVSSTLFVLPGILAGGGVYLLYLLVFRKSLFYGR